jgi:CPA1 family monovalent cation:H+ antiporter
LCFTARYRFAALDKICEECLLILTWGGLRGGLAVAMALSLPKNMHRDKIVLITCIIVILSIIVRDLTVGKQAAKMKG